MPRQIFKGCVLATAGQLPGQYTTQNLKQWIKLRKGDFVEDLTENVTHLLCTREHYFKKVPRVREALALGKHLHIVHYDWFEFSTVLNKKQHVKEYSMKRLEATRRAIRRERARIEKGKRDAEKFVNTNHYHVYRDRKGFAYQFDITKEVVDDDLGCKNCERYTFCLWESNARPHLYWFTARFLRRKGDSQPQYYRSSEFPRKLLDEYRVLTHFFQKKTKIEWRDRVTLQNTKPGEFQYAPPTGGKPVGCNLRFSYDYCKQVNAELLGIPLPSEDSPAAASSGEHTVENADDGADEDHSRGHQVAPVDHDAGPSDHMTLEYESDTELRETLGEVEESKDDEMTDATPAISFEAEQSTSTWNDAAMLAAIEEGRSDSEE